LNSTHSTPDFASWVPQNYQPKLPKSEQHPHEFAHWCALSLGVSPGFVRNKINEFLVEDHGGGCATLIGLSTGTKSPHPRQAVACIVAKQDFVLCGLPLLAETFRLVSDGQAQFFADVADGDSVQSGQIMACIVASPSQLLLGERVALNLTSHLSGISTYTAQVVKKIKETCATKGLLKPTLLETRKTTPGLRAFEKYATRQGGARNHRHSLDTGAMLKENHLRAFGGIEASLEKSIACVPFLTKVEIEVSTLAELKMALQKGADVIMLDNFSAEDTRLAVQLRSEAMSKVAFELSGNLDRKNLAEICSLGVEFLSMGALVHQSTWVDMSLQLYAPNPEAS
jgi:nicotinate-nucleotide pyrophosphorylase (carboxylating)